MSEIRDKIHELFGVKEPHELPAAMMEVINDSTKLSVICSNYKKMFPNTKHDYLRDYFQENQADRSNLMQDYTPQSICQIVAEITGKRQLIADLCAGTGSLTLEAWSRNPDAEFICYELSSAAVPFLCFNLAVRSISARYCVIEPDRDRVDAFFFYRILQKGMPKFLSKEQTGLNIRPQILDRFPVRYFADMNIQKYISAEQYLYETEMQYEHDQIEMLEHFKKYLLQVMFC